MRHLHLTTATPSSVTTTTSAMSPSSSSSSAKPKSSNTSNNTHTNNNNNPNSLSSSSSSSSHSLLCKHSPSATLDLLILILVVCSGAFLLTSYFSYIANSISLLLAQSTPHLHDFPIPHILGLFLFFAIAVILVEFCCGARSRKCDKPGCKGLKKAMEFDLQLQTEQCAKSGCNEIDRLPWKGGSEGNPDYECLRSELRKMAPPNGRAILLFRARCGCPIAKLEGWGPKRGKRHKKSSQNVTQNGGYYR